MDRPPLSTELLSAGVFAGVLLPYAAASLAPLLVRLSRACRDSESRDQQGYADRQYVAHRQSMFQRRRIIRTQDLCQLRPGKLSSPGTPRMRRTSACRVAHARTDDPVEFFRFGGHSDLPPRAPVTASPQPPAYRSQWLRVLAGPNTFCILRMVGPGWRYPSSYRTPTGGVHASPLFMAPATDVRFTSHNVRRPELPQSRSLRTRRTSAHSTTSSARPSSDGGIVRPMARAVLRLGRK